LATNIEGESLWLKENNNVALGDNPGAEGGDSVVTSATDLERECYKIWHNEEEGHIVLQHTMCGTSGCIEDKALISISRFI
jgi:hypothetical protein